MPKKLDLARYDGHTPGPWEWTLPVLEPGILKPYHDPRYGMPQINAKVIDLVLMADAPRLLAEVKELRAALEKLRNLWPHRSAELHDAHKVIEAVREIAKNALDGK